MVFAIILLAVLLLWVTLDDERTRRTRDRSHAAEVKRLEHMLNDERAHNADLLNRLASRNLPEYQAYVEPPSRQEVEQYLTDDFGFITVPAAEVQ